MRHVGLPYGSGAVAGDRFLLRPSFAVLQFYMQYKKDYLDNHSDKEYAETVNKSANRCFVCHQGQEKQEEPQRVRRTTGRSVGLEEGLPRTRRRSQPR